MIMSYFCGSELQIQHDPAWPSAWGGRSQGACRAVIFTGGSGEESSSSLIQFAG